MDDDLSLVVLADAKDRMEKAVGHTQSEFGGVRTGRATSGLVEHLRVDPRLHVYEVEVQVQIETRGGKHTDEVLSRLQAAGYSPILG